eukprot:UN07716
MVPVCIFFKFSLLDLLDENESGLFLRSVPALFPPTVKDCFELKGAYSFSFCDEPIMETGSEISSNCACVASPSLISSICVLSNRF